MIVLEGAFEEGHGPPRRQTVLIFGLGLIGRSVLNALKGRSSGVAHEMQFTWAGGAEQANDVDGVFERVGRMHAGGEPARFDIVWTAGRGGFGSNEAELEPELRSYERVLALADRLVEHFPGAHHTFHLMSSAGGLFEGQCNVEPDAEPNPRRPYGELKLAQESRLSDPDPRIRKFVYRPSSVYGFVAGGNRMGLITTLIHNGILRNVSRVFGDPLTLRDYVLADDVGRFVAERVVGRACEPGVFTLVSGKPSSISEILRMTEALLDRSVYVIYQSTAENVAHNTFLPGVMPSARWAPSGLQTGMQLTKLSLFDFFAESGTRVRA